jgi:hypothetical protein
MGGRIGCPPTSIHPETSAPTGEGGHQIVIEAARQLAAALASLGAAWNT